MEKSHIFGIKKVAAIMLGVYIITYYIITGIFYGSQISIFASDILSIIGEGAGIIMIIFGIHCQEEKRSKIEWLIFAIGLGLHLIGDLIWSIYEMLLYQEVPFLSICDAFYVCSSVCYLIALIFKIRHEKVLDAVRTVFDVAITMVASMTIIIKFIMLPIWYDYSLTFLQKSISLAYPIFDLGYLGGIISLLFFCSKPKFNLSNLLISVAFCIWFFGDMFYAILSSNTYVSGGFLDPLWPVGSWILALGSLYSPYRRKESSEQNTKNRRSYLVIYLRLLLPYLSGSIVIILVSYENIFKDALVAGAVITILLIMIRQILILIENKRLILMIQKTNLFLEKGKMDLEEQNIELQYLNHLKEREANTDYLTNMFNRRYVYETSQSLLEQYANNKKMELCVLLIDIDHYKQINDQWGHETGDVVLQQIAKLIEECIRPTDIAGRFGGDEFIIILPNANLHLGKFVAEELVTKTNAKEFLVNNSSLKVTLSIGCVGWKGALEEYNMKAVIAATDKALYKAKANGRNQYIIEEFKVNASDPRTEV